MSTPQSTIKVCSNLRLNNSYEHTIWFKNKTEQLDYFTGKVVKTFSGYTYLRKAWSIKVQATMSEARTWSYLFFDNADGKTWYYFINNIEYINDATVELFLELDVIQTYFFDFTLQQCFVEREHSASDNIGDHILDEDLELGDMVVNDQMDIDLGEMSLLIMTSISLISEISEDYHVTTLGEIYNGVYSGLTVYAVDINNQEDLTSLQSRLSVLNDVGKIDSIFAMWMYPKSLIRLQGANTWGSGLWCKYVGATEKYIRSTPKDYELHGYTPSNNKLYCYPYNFLYVSNNSGDASIYKYERFSTEQCEFKISGAISPDASAVCIPMDYNGVLEDAIKLSGFPTCSWQSDTYKLWLAQNQASNNLSTGMGALSIVGGAATAIIGGATGVGAPAVAGGLAMMANGASQIAGVMASKKDASVQPPQARGTFSIPVNVAQGKQTFTFQFKSVDYTHARSIDNYFSLYGYKCHRVKRPNIHVRENWTYTKTIGCHVSGNLCTEDLVKIESIFNNGVTFWVNGNSIGIYDLSNRPLK